MVNRPRICGHVGAGWERDADEDERENPDTTAECYRPAGIWPGVCPASVRAESGQLLDPGGVRQLQSVILADVTSAVGTSGTAITSRVHSLNRPNMVSVGTIVWLSSELMFFAGLFAMYFTARAQAGGDWPPEPTELNLALAVPVTLVLIASSMAAKKARSRHTSPKAPTRRPPCEP